MITIGKEPVNKIELHYYFADTSHSMNALVRNKCEVYLLGILKEISSTLNARIQVETEAYTEGGLRERFLLRGKSEYNISLAAAIFRYVLPLEVDIEKIVSEEDKQETKNSIDQLRKDIRDFERDSDTQIDLENIEALFRNNLKILKLKSNFYRQLSGYEKVSKFSVQLIHADGTNSGKPATVNRKQFDTYMLVADTLKPEQDDAAVIEIVSPVLKTGSYKWKGIYMQANKTISFAMRDEEFKKEVINTGMMFKNGTRIVCSLEINRKMSEFGEVVVTGYSVLSVTGKHDEAEALEVPKPRTTKKKKEPKIQQLDLFGF
jgi:hypothetical protein